MKRMEVFPREKRDGRMFATVIRAMFARSYSIHKCLASGVAEAVGVGCLVAKWERARK